MTEISEIDMDKYIVIKKDDLRYLSLDLKSAMAQIVANINHSRKVIDKKPQNQYLVLNMNDDISPNYLYHKMIEYERIRAPIFKVKDIAVDLVNAILKAKCMHGAQRA